MAVGVGGLAPVNPCVLDDSVVDDESGSGRLRLDRHSLGAHDALTQGVEPLQSYRLTDGCSKEENTNLFIELYSSLLNK